MFYTTNLHGHTQNHPPYSQSWTTECIGPTPPRIPGSWFFRMSVSHSLTAYWMTLSTPNSLGNVKTCKSIHLNFQHPDSSVRHAKISSHSYKKFKPGLNIDHSVHIVGKKQVNCYPCRQHSLLSLSSEQLSCASPIRMPAKVPWEKPASQTHTSATGTQ